MAIRVLARITPPKPKAGDVFKLQVVAQHPMEPGTRKDEQGNLIPAHYIDQVDVYFEGQKVSAILPEPGVSANPLFGLEFQAGQAGTFNIKLKDNKGDTGEASVKLELA
ncbi:thiosulfate oxidation carrier complex protein SoxZ [Meiothermus granaticius]|uniref:Thiosulfate oxidation carrier complex protein SoxZ n=1 Tax=Meiothermus granaticius NBRC 107808 TaxID=1227551 RepID=A0A399F5K2_9DEIN|nr:thiosulfate oxidation carrier complex protein SoxZ [Meiothermus granaticius]RIH91508.1 thiosulfate oxidation carrier complex protein SoxZ [Meiothermus granaticius NBRC 107808]GEM88241.1 thiosulfate oxidation carrier complex protein SoxZ [Meiothermus granaticius NBRC 107808]